MAAYKYSYGKVANLFKNSAEIAGPVCMALKESERGLSPETLLEASRPEEAPLHNEFEWNDTVAADNYRKEQARSIIRHLIIVRTDIETPVSDRAFVYVGEKKTGYVPISEAMSNETWRKNLMSAARKDMQFFIAKYRRLEELAEIIEKMSQILSEEDAG